MSSQEANTGTNLEGRVKELEDTVHLLIDNLAINNAALVKGMAKLLDFLRQKGTANPPDLKDVIGDPCDHDPPGCKQHHHKR